MGAGAGFCEVKFRPTGNNFFAEGQKGLKHLPNIHLLWFAAIEGQHVGAEILLHRRIAEKLVQHDISYSITLELDNNAHAYAVRFIANRRDTFNTFFINKSRYLLDHISFIDLIG